MVFNRPRWARIENDVERKILGEQARVTLKAGFPWKSVQGSMGYYPIIGAGRNSDAQWPRIFRADDTPCTLCKSFLCSLLARAFIERLSFVERTGTWAKLWLSKIHERFFPWPSSRTIVASGLSEHPFIQFNHCKTYIVFPSILILFILFKIIFLLGKIPFYRLMIEIYIYIFLRKT